MDEQNALQKLVEQCGGIDNIVFLIKTSKLDLTPAMFGLPFAFKSSGDPQIEVEASISKTEDDLYSLEHGYKVILKCHDERYGNEKYYQSDLHSLIMRGDIKYRLINPVVRNVS